MASEKQSQFGLQWKHGMGIDENAYHLFAIAQEPREQYRGDPSIFRLVDHNNDNPHILVMETEYSICIHVYSRNALKDVAQIVLTLLNYQPCTYVFSSNISSREFAKLLSGPKQICCLGFLNHSTTIVNEMKMITNMTLSLTALDSFYEFMLCLKRHDAANSTLCEDVVRTIYAHLFDHNFHLNFKNNSKRFLTVEDVN
jgi:hypothetical protein